MEVLEDRTLLADGISASGGPPIIAVPGQALSNVVVATYTIANSSGDPGDKWRARVSWGDNTASDKKISPTALADGSFEFLDSHTYAAAGTYTVTVNIAAPGSHLPNDNTVTTSVTIRVLNSISVAPSSPSVPKGETETFTATGTFADGSTLDLTNLVTWASATTTVATISNASGSKGVATAVAQGTSTISATFNGHTGSAVLTVTPPAVQSIAVTPANSSVAKGLTQQFTATGTLSDGTTTDLTGQVTWASASQTVATIDTHGLATALSAGTSTIRATLNGITGSTILTVTPPVVQSIAVTPAGPSVPKGLTQAFKATGTLSDHSTQDLTSQVTWASSQTAVATISNAAGSRGLATAIAQGTSTISAALNGLTGSAVLTVIAPVLRSIAVTPANPSLPKGLTQAFTATGTFSDNSTQDLTNQVTWASATTTVATITTHGLATASAQGTSNINATLDGISGSTVLTVTAPVLQSIAVAPISPSVAKGLTQQFTATGTLSDSSTEDLTDQVTWHSDTISVATIAAGGIATAVGEGTARINATLDSLTGSTVLTVIAPILQSIAVAPVDPSVAKGLTQQFTALGTLSDSTTQDLTDQVTWDSTDTSIATITAAGLATAVAQGTSTIKATVDGVTGSTVLTVGPAVLLSITVGPDRPSIIKGTSQAFTATGTLSDSTTEDLTGQVTWASNHTSVATIDAGGLATGVASGSSTISATLDGISGSTSLAVIPAPLASIAVTPADPSVAKGLTQQFTATGTFSDGSSQDLTSQVAWASTDTTVATIDAAGLAAAAGLGTTTITATLNGFSDSTALTVTAPVLQSIAVTPAHPSLPKGLTESFTATGTLSDGTTEDLTSQVAWASTNTTVATIDAAGLAAAVAEGTSNIRATLDGIAGSTILTVTPPVLQSIAVTPTDPSVPKGLTDHFLATGTLSDNSTEDLTGRVTWTSSQTTVATIDGNGVATAVAQGTSNIGASLDGIDGTTTITVIAPILRSIAITPANPALPRGESQQFTATGTLSDGTTENLTGQARWASATPLVATIDSAGLAAGLDEGTSIISATMDSVSGSTILTVGPAALVSLSITPAAPSIVSGTTQHFTVTGTFSDQTTLDLTSQVAWASTTASVASIDPAGLARGVAPGTSRISATRNGIEASTILAVTPAPLVSISVRPANPNVPAGEPVSFTAIATFADDSNENVTTQVHWASSLPTVAIINASGVATGLTTGNASISATMDSVSGSTILTVAPAVLLSIAITPADPSLVGGTTQAFTAIGTFSDRSQRDVTGQVTWSSASLSTASVSVSGVATGLAPGTSTITATLGQIRASTSVTVIPAPVTVPTTPVSVDNIQIVQDKKHRLRQITIGFGGALDPLEAASEAHYRIVKLGKHGSLAGRGARFIRLKSAIYNAALDQVTLTLKRSVPLRKPLELQISGILHDSSGRPIDGGQSASFVLGRHGTAITPSTVSISRPGPVHSTAAAADAVLVRCVGRR